MNYDPLAILAYETFLLSQYQIETQGLYYKAGTYLIHCPMVNKDTLAQNGGTLYKWFSNNKIMGTQIEISNKIPNDFVKIDEKVQKTKPLDSGFLVTHSDFEYEIQLLIPKRFPEFNVGFNSNGVLITFEKPVPSRGLEELKEIFVGANFQGKFSFQSGEVIKKEKIKNDPFSIGMISTYNNIKSNLGESLRYAWEEEEDNWVRQRNRILTSIDFKVNDFKSENLKERKFRCLIDCTFGQPDNIRNYLTMYAEVCLILPKNEDQEKILGHLGVTRKEMVELIALGKIHVLISKSIELYDTGFIQELLEANRKNLHLTRNVAVMTLMEMRKRNPFLFPAIPTEEKQLLLSAVQKSTSEFSGNDKLAEVIRRTISETGQGWSRFPNAINQHDSTLLTELGTISLLSPLFEHVFKKDLKIDLMICAPAVEIAAAVGAILIPVDIEGYDTSPISSVVANLYSGTPDEDLVMLDRESANFTANEILSISKYLPVVELAKTFNSVEIDRFRKLVLDIATHQPSFDDISETVEAYNHFVKLYEKDRDKYAKWNIKGFVIGLAGKQSGIPMASWLMGHAFKYIGKSASNTGVSDLLRFLNASVQGGLPDAILISSMKEKVRKQL